VARAIDILRTDIIRTLKLLGCPAIRDLDRSFIEMPSAWMDVERSPTFV
jgi:L-lactate dehydrogenase (cytochrome)